jgi:hypothetical protein
LHLSEEIIDIEEALAWIKDNRVKIYVGIVAFWIFWPAVKIKIYETHIFGLPPFERLVQDLRKQNFTVEVIDPVEEKKNQASLFPNTLMGNNIGGFFALLVRLVAEPQSIFDSISGGKTLADRVSKDVLFLKINGITTVVIRYTYSWEAKAAEATANKIEEDESKKDTLCRDPNRKKWVTCAEIINFRKDNLLVRMNPVKTFNAAPGHIFDQYYQAFTPEELQAVREAVFN